jgi:hypothetical protein
MYPVAIPLTSTRSLVPQFITERPTMMKFIFQATLITSIQVKGETRGECEQKLRAALAASAANLGMLNDELIVGRVEIEGDLDLLDVDECAGNSYVGASGDS